MNIKEIAKQYHISSLDDFTNFLSQYNLSYSKSAFGTITIEDHLVAEYVKAYNTNINYRNQKAQEQARAISKMLISSGFNFDGYRITKYSGYISGDAAIQIPRSGVFGGNNGENLTNALVHIRRIALAELKQAAYNLGCNAIIGVDFDYITLQPETASMGGGTLYEPYIICVTANGNAVIIEKEI